MRRPARGACRAKEGKAPARGACRDDRAHIKPFKSKVYKIRDRDPGKWSLPGRPFQAQDRTSEGTPRQGPGTGKLQSPASSLPRQDQDPGKALAGRVALCACAPAHQTTRRPGGYSRDAWRVAVQPGGARWHSLVAEPSPWQTETQ